MHYPRRYIKYPVFYQFLKKIMDFINFTRNFKQQLEKVQHDSVAKIKILTVKSTGPGMEDPTH